MYIQAIRRGCRCVELDCWDGPGGEPVIYHGHTLTSKISFREVVAAIASVVFEEYETPFILSLEVHCCVRQQERMAEHMRHCFGDDLLLPDAARRTQCSPMDLQHRIIVKAKRRNRDSVVEARAARQRSKSTSKPSEVASTTAASSPATDLAIAVPEQPPEAATATRRGSMPAVMPSAATHSAPTVTGVRARRDSDEEHALWLYGSHAVATGLAACTGLEAVRLKVSAFLARPTNTGYPAGPWVVSSVNEPKMQKWLREGFDRRIAIHTMHHLLRVYPGALRVSSSNFKPTLFWSLGVQMVALNFQTHDTAMQLNQALFKLNGGCGYVLKPSRLRPIIAVDRVMATPIATDPHHGDLLLRNWAYSLHQNKGMLRLQVHVLGARYLQASNATPGSASIGMNHGSKVPKLHPSCCVKLHSGGDSITVLETARGKSGLNPVWNEIGTVVVHQPDTAFLHFEVAQAHRDRLGRSESLAYCVIPVAALRCGVRMCSLRSPFAGKRIPYCHLVCMFKVADV